MNEIPKNNSFKTPENYLEDFSVSVSETKTRSAFSTPDNYFEEFKVELPNKETTPNLIKLFNTYRISVIAAAITILIAVPLLLNSNSANGFDMEQLSFQELDTYLQSTQNQFDYFELASELPEGTTELDFIASNNSNIEAYIDLQIQEYSELNLYSDDY